MNAEKFFEEMYHNIWQSRNLSRFDDFYAKYFEETISVADQNKQPLDLQMNYEDPIK